MAQANIGLNTLTNLQTTEAATTNYPIDTLKTFDADFIAYRSGKDIGSAKIQLIAIENDLFELTYESKVSRFFLSDKRYERTVFSSTEQDLIPLSYQYKRSGTGPNKNLSVAFEKETTSIVVNKEDTMAWEGELDNQLFRIDLAAKLAQGITKTSYDFINYRGEKRHYELEVVSTENITLPYGQLSAIKVKINRESKKRVTYAWFAPSLNYNLVRLQQFKDNKEQGDMQLSSFSYL